MALPAGTRLALYEIVEPIGAGAMGEVYRARDTKLGREVAIKILPEAFSQDAERLARFEREARLLASLNHPHIATLHGFENADGVHFLVMELVEGETLAERIANGPMSPDEALPLFRQIADGLESAHDKRIVHRDLKPPNIKITLEGNAKVLDFGLAKDNDTGTATPSPSESPTVTKGTAAGIILGTAAYMSPEQARGKTVDRRTDVWAFGCCLFEALTGKAAFLGETISDTISNVLSHEPDWQSLPATTPKSVKLLLRKCLRKDSQRRLRDIGDARVELEDALSEKPEAAAIATLEPPARVWRLAATLAVLAGVAAGTLVWFLTRPSAPQVSRLAIPVPANQAIKVDSGVNLAISPDGSTVVYAGRDEDGGTQLYVRPIAELETTPLLEPGVNPSEPFFSPDGEWVAFLAGNAPYNLMKVSIHGGPPTMISELPLLSMGMSWGPYDRIIFAGGGRGLWSVPANGGDPELLTSPDVGAGERWHSWPEILPDGRTVLFTIGAGAPDHPVDSQIAVFSLDSGETKPLLTAASHPHFIPTGYIVYVASGVLRAVRFDIDRLEVVGEGVTLMENVLTYVDGGSMVAIARNGSLIYISGESPTRSLKSLVWTDRLGRETPLPIESRAFEKVRLNPAGTKLAYGPGQKDVWIWDLARETETRFTFDSGRDGFPEWTPDGNRIVFSSDRAGSMNLYWKPADGTGEPERLTHSQDAQFVQAWTHDGKQLVLHKIDPTTSRDLYILALAVEQSAEPLLKTSFNESAADISPDDKWIAYASNESGRDEVYVRPFPDVDSGKWQISTDGGRVPAWSPDGRELFYNSGERMMRVSVQTEPDFAAGIPELLFEGRYYYGNNVRGYDISPDGQRFLMIKEPDSSVETVGATQINVVLNWFEEIERLVP